MKSRCVIFFLHLLLTTVVSAEEDWRITCESLGKLATNVMTSHQSGTSMSELMKLANGNDFIEKIIISAYESPRYSSKKMQDRSTGQFRDKIYLECVHRLKDK
jgi:hypothetical protein